MREGVQAGRRSLACVLACLRACLLCGGHGRVVVLCCAVLFFGKVHNIMRCRRIFLGLFMVCCLLAVRTIIYWRVLEDGNLVFFQTAEHHVQNPFFSSSFFFYLCCPPPQRQQRREKGIWV